MNSNSLYILLSYTLVSCTPILLIFFSKSNDHFLQSFAFGIFSWVGLWTLFKRPRWFHYFLLPAFLILPIEVYLRIYFNQGISTHHFGIVAETSPQEAMEFLGHKIWLFIALSIFIFLWWWSLLIASKNNHQLDWKHQSRFYILGFLTLYAALAYYAHSFGIEKKSSSVASTSATLSNPWRIQSLQDIQLIIDKPPALPRWTHLFLDEKAFSQSWPLGLYSYGIDFYNERIYLTKLKDKNKHFFFLANQNAAHDLTQTIVVVIGESSRYDRWSLHGYHRETNPLLKNETQIVSFNDLITPVSATRLSVPIITTRKSAQDSLKPGFFEKSFISAFKEAGFKTYWISNQMSFGQFDTPTSVIAKEADEVQFLNLGGFTNQSSYDEVLLEPMSKAMRDESPKKLIVLHTLGNHWNYSHRHPEEFNKWQPSFFGVDKPSYTNAKNKELLSNSYDNSILYTDWMLSQTISKLKNENALTALMYVADHGQTLFDGTCKYAFHGHNNKREFHIPAFVWYSNAYQKRFPDKVAMLKKNKNAKLSTENIFHSLLDMVDIRYPTEQLNRSVFSPLWKEHVRYVDSYGWSNYDNATLKGDCLEVIDKQTPLKQEK